MRSSLHPLRSRARRLVAAGLALACASGACAAGAAVIDENALRAQITQQVAAAGGESLTRFDVKLGTVNVQALAPCQRTESFVPSGARLWGRTSVGLRCVDGASWTVLMPVTIQVWGRAVVAAMPLNAGTVIGLQDLREQEVELTREPAGVVRDPQLLAGRTLTRSLHAGQVLRTDMARVTAVVHAGDPVRLRMSGPGFMVMAGGQALAAAGEGQSVRVRTDLGKVLVGVAREGRLVDVTL